MRTDYAATTMAVICATVTCVMAGEEQHPRLMATPEVVAKVRKLAEVKGSHHEQALAAIRERVKTPLESPDAGAKETSESASNATPAAVKSDSKPDVSKTVAPNSDSSTQPGSVSSADANVDALLGIEKKTDAAPKQAPKIDPAPTVKAKTGPNAKDFSRRAGELAFLSLFSTDKDEGAKLASEAADLLEKAIKIAGKKGLAFATVSLNLAEAYDWAYPALPQAKRDSLRAGIVPFLDAWPKVARYWKGSNKQAVERSAELMLMLALCEEKNRAERYAKLKEGLIQDYFEVEYSDMGISQEGLGYSEYPSQFYWPAVHSARCAGDEDFFRAACKHASWKMGMYTHNFMPHARKFVQFGVDWSGNYDEGWASGLLPTTPADQVPYVLWWYDRHMGLKAPGALVDRFDRDHGGNFMSLLLYPGGIEPKDPTGVFPAMIADNQGRFFFRNRWQDANDLQVTFAADAHDIPCGWDSPICFAFNLMGYDTRFFGGPGKDGGVPGNSKLLIDNQIGSAKKTGKVIASEAFKDGGYILADGGDQYGEQGCTSARRHFLVKFLPDNSAIIVTLDQVAVDKPRTITWQGNIGAGKETPDLHGVTIAPAPRGFLLRGRANGAVRGWVVTPTTAKIVAADPIQVSVTGESADIMVVLWIGASEPPNATVAGAALESVLSIGQNRVRFDAKSNRVVAE